MARLSDQILSSTADVLARIPTHPNKRIHELLPYHWKPPQPCHTAINHGEKAA